MTSLPQLTPGTALVLVGPQGCGKTTFARAIAQQYGAFEEVDVRGLQSAFGLGNVLARQPKTVIVNGFPKTCESLKAFVAGPTVIAHRKGKEELAVPAPNFIFLTSGTAALDQSDRRFVVLRWDGSRFGFAPGDAAQDGATTLTGDNLDLEPEPNTPREALIAAGWVPPAPSGASRLRVKVFRFEGAGVGASWVCRDDKGRLCATSDPWKALSADDFETVRQEAPHRVFGLDWVELE